MIRLFWRLALLAALATLFAWLADRPGTVTLRWLNREIETPVMVAVATVLMALAILWFLWRLLRGVWRAPATTRDYMRFRRSRRGYESLSRGIIAAGAGDTAAAQRHADLAQRGLPDEPLVKLLAAQAAQLRGDRAAVKRAFEAMLGDRDTEALGLRGLFAEARQAGDIAKAREYADRALKLNPSLPWASSALLSLQSSAKDWSAAMATLEKQRKSGAIDTASANRKRAALLSAEALPLETTDRDRAFVLASEAHKLDPALVPAALIAARIEAGRNSLRKAMKILRRTWQLSPHVAVAEAAAFARPADTPENRLARVRDLVALKDGGDEGKVALARAAIAARAWTEARQALEPLIEGRPQARVCALMADLEEGETGERGRAREWLARAMRAAPDPMWVADGIASPVWMPVSPVTGEIGNCEWKVPFDSFAAPEAQAAIAEAPPPATPAAEPPKPALRPQKPQPVAAGPRQPDDPGAGETHPAAG
jgi:HemY protein